MKRLFRHSWFGLFVLFLLAGCAATVPERLPAYFGPVEKPPHATAAVPRPSSVALVVINDTSAPGSAPALSSDALNRLAQRLAFRLEQDVGLAVRTVMIQPPDITPTADPAQFARLAERAGVDTLLVAVLSSAEVEVPDRLPLQGSLQGGGGRGMVLGFRAENYALAELALVDGRTGRPLVHANGQAWAVLERLNVPLESNVYPVVRRDLTMPPIYPSEDLAYDTLRSVAADDAILQAMMHLKELWSGHSTG